MARPVKQRNDKSYLREIEQLGRLRTALLMDTSIEYARCNDTVKQIDKLISQLIEIKNSLLEKKSA